jgi:hypothetical protein
VGQVNRSKYDPLRSGHDPLDLTEVWLTPLDRASGCKKATRRRIQNDDSSSLKCVPVVFCENYHTAGAGDYHLYLDRIDKGSSSLPDVAEAEMFVFLR